MLKNNVEYLIKAYLKFISKYDLKMFVEPNKSKVIKFNETDGSILDNQSENIEENDEE